MSGALVTHDLREFLGKADAALCENCELIAPKSVLGKLTVSLSPAPGHRKDIRITLRRPDLRGKVRIILGPGTTEIDIATAGPVNLDLRMWRNSTFKMGLGTTVNNAQIVCDDADVVVGKDGLWSGDILIQSNDQHGIIDLTTNTLINNKRRFIEIGDHVWVGRRAIIMPDVRIGSGSILAAGTVVTCHIAEKSIAAGVPARIVRENATWSRTPTGFSDAERDLLNIDTNKTNQTFKGDLK